MKSLSMEPAIVLEHLSRTFSIKDGKEKKEVQALQDLSLAIPRGELFGLLGPNGAGKTTLIKILSTLLLPTSGKAFVGGYDIEKDTRPIRKIINMVAGGEYAGYGMLTVRENLLMFSQFYNLELKKALATIDGLLKLVGLEEKAKTRVNQLSTGMRQKLNFARGFINDPQIIFLDEPTLGLDVTTSRELRSFVKSWVGERQERSVILTTHYMAEADELCDRLAIINGGKIVACESPRVLKAQVADASIYEIEARCGEEGWGAALKEVPGMKGVTFHPGKDGHLLVFKLVLENDNSLEHVFSTLLHRGAGILSVKKQESSLEDVFISLCGRGLDDENGRVS